MYTSTLFKSKTVFSFEIFPPKPSASPDAFEETLQELTALSPDFISVTNGAGGNGSDDTIQIAADIQSKYGVKSVAHLPCIHRTKESILEMLQSIEKTGIKNILALRGDIQKDVSPKSDFQYASDLTAFIKEHGEFNVIGACYPEGHTESGGLVRDIRNLKTKVNAGADQLISQLFFDNNYFYAFLERAAIAEINVPIQAGIMPVTNKKQVERMVALCGAALPKKLIRMVEKYGDNSIALQDAGIAYAVDQIIDLIAQGVDGIHLYTMNNSYITAKISSAAASLLKADPFTA